MLSVSEYSAPRAGISEASIPPQASPRHGLRPRKARFRFAQQDYCSSTTSIRLNFRIARHPSGIDVKRGDHCLQADFSGLIRTVEAADHPISNGRRSHLRLGVLNLLPSYLAGIRP